MSSIPEDQPPRPANAFMLYRIDQHKIIKQGEGAPGRESDISKYVGKKWAEETQAVKNLYKARACAIAAEHKRQWPHYKFMPGRQRASKKKSRAAARHGGAVQSYNGPQQQSQVPSVPISMPFTPPCSSTSTSSTGSAWSAQTSPSPSPPLLEFSPLLGDASAAQALGPALPQDILAVARQQNAMLAFQQLQYVKMIRAIAFRRQAILRAVLANQNTTPDVNGNAPPQLPAAGFNPSVHAQFAPLHAQQQQQPAQLQMPSPITVPQVMDMSPFTQKTQAPGWEAPLDAGFCDFTAAQNNPIQDAAQPDNALAPTTSEPGDAPSQLDSPMLGPLPTWKEEHEDAPVPSVMENSHSAATGEGDDAGQSVSTDALDDIQTYDNAPFDALPVRAVWQEDLDDLSFDSSEGKAWFDFTDSV